MRQECLPLAGGTSVVYNNTPLVNSLNDGVYTNIFTVTFDPGVYIVRCQARFEKNGNGIRGLSLSQTSQWNGAENVIKPLENERTTISNIKLYTFSQQATLYAIAFQSSGGSLELNTARLEYYKIK